MYIQASNLEKQLIKYNDSIDDMIGYDIIWYDMIWYDIWHMIWYDMMYSVSIRYDYYEIGYCYVKKACIYSLHSVDIEVCWINGVASDAYLR